MGRDKGEQNLTNEKTEHGNRNTDLTQRQKRTDLTQVTLRTKHRDENKKIMLSEL